MNELTIRQLDKMPKTKAKYKKKQDLRKLIQQFDDDKMKYAEIPVIGEHTVRGLKIGLGRVLAVDNRNDIEVFESIDSKTVILRRK